MSFETLSCLVIAFFTGYVLATLTASGWSNHKGETYLANEVNWLRNRLEEEIARSWEDGEDETEEADY